MQIAFALTQENSRPYTDHSVTTLFECLLLTCLIFHVVVRYAVATHTGDKRGAGTDANVFITIFGYEGDTGERRLDNSKNNFERNRFLRITAAMLTFIDLVSYRVDQFVVESPSLGQIERVRISHDNKGFGPGWYLDKVCRYCKGNTAKPQISFAV